LIERSRPLRKTLFGESHVLNRSALAKTVEMPSLGVRPPDQDQANGLTGAKGQRLSRFERPLIVTSVNHSHRFPAITDLAELYGLPTKRLNEQSIVGSAPPAQRQTRRAAPSDNKTMRGFDESCLTPAAPLTPHQIRALREREHVSQTVFANYLNVTPNLVSKWERGEKKPSGPALKLLSLVERHGLTAIA
jgi:putative transcriptional regulator